MQSCSCTEYPASNFIKRSSLFNCLPGVLDNNSQHPVYRPPDPPQQDNNQYTYRPFGHEKDDDLVSHTKKAIILQKKYHAYRKIWNCNQFASQCAKSKGLTQKVVSDENEKLSSKFWPPPIVPVRGGLQIPVEYVSETDQPWSTCSGVPPIPDYYPGLLGEDELTDDKEDLYHLHRIRAQPRDEIPAEEMEDMTREKCVKGVLNTHESEQFVINPPSVIFMGSQIGKVYEVVVKVRNKGALPRRMSVINPQNPCFDVIWGAGLGQNTLLAAGLTNKIVVRFSPPKSGQGIHDMVTIIIDEDGAIVVPIIAESSSKPILQMEDWEMGCSLLGQSRVSTFEIINRGGDARFWILSEEEFVNEYLELRGPIPKPLPRRSEEEIDGEIDEEYEEELREEKKEARNKMLRKADHLLIEPFKLYPSCFHLGKNQYTHIQISYQPTETGFHVRKLALVCDNGEVRWVVVTGAGIDPSKTPLLSFQGTWSAPPMDLPTDLSTRLTLNCGDLLAGERKSQTFTLKNNSCMPLYVFWSIRQLRSGHDSFYSTTSSESSSIPQLQLEGLNPVHWDDYEKEMKSIPLKIHPAQAILKGHEEIQCEVFMEGSLEQGYHAAVLSVFVQQLCSDSEKILTPLLQQFENQFGNDLPIPNESLIRTLPPKKQKKKRRKEISGRHQEKTGKQNVHSTAEKSRKNESESLNHSDHEKDESLKNISKQIKSIKRGPCTKSTEKSWTLGPMFCPIICLERLAPNANDNANTFEQSQFKSLEGNTPADLVHQKHSEDTEGSKDPGQALTIMNGRKGQAALHSITPYTMNPIQNEVKKLPKYVFPPPPIFYIQKAMTIEDGRPNCDFALAQLNYTRQTFNSSEETGEVKYEDYFGKTCRVPGESKNSEEKKEESLENVFSPTIEEHEEEDEEDNGNEEEDGEGMGEELIEEEMEEEEEEDMEEYLEVERYKKQMEKPRLLEIEGCILQHQFKAAQKWLDASSPLQPSEEIEVWSQTVPLQCYFEPPQVTGHGQHSHKILRTVDFVNHTAHEVQLSIDPVILPVGTIICRPFEVKVGPFDKTVLHFTFDFRKRGDHTGKIGGHLKLPFTRVPCWLPFRIIAEGPTIQLLSPIVNFGFVLQGSELCKKIVLKNTGTLQTKWKATIPPESLVDDCLHQLCLSSSEINRMTLVRPWPTWGTIDPGQTVGIQVYLSGHCPAKLSCSCEIIFDDDPTTTIYVTILADIQSPWVILDKCRLPLLDIFSNTLNLSAKALLKNLTSFCTPFKWLDEPFGKQKNLCTVRVTPFSGILLPKGSLECQIEFTTPHSFIMDNLFLLCCVEGMKEPLVVKLEGAVFKLCLKIVIPKTKLYKIKDKDLMVPDCDSVWKETICGDEMDGEDQTLNKYFVDYLGAYGKYCIIKNYDVQAPPPSVSGLEEEMSLTKFDEEEEEEEEEMIAEKVGKKGKRSKGKKSKSKEKSGKAKKKKSKSKSKEKSEKKEKKSKSKEKPDKGKKKKGKSKSKEKGKKGKSPKGGKKSKKKNDKKVEEVKEEPEEEEEEEEEETIQEPIDNRENPFANMMPEDFDPALMTSEGKLIYFQIREHGEVAIVKFWIHNEAPLPTPFELKVIQHPFHIPEEVKVKEGQQFLKLDQDFFKRVQHYHRMEQLGIKRDFLGGKSGAVFHVHPGKGILEAFHSVEITVEFHTNTPGIFEDQLECHFEGLENPYVIKLEALATMCEKRCIPRLQEIPKPESVETVQPICERRLNPLLY